MIARGYEGRVLFVVVRELDGRGAREAGRVIVGQVVWTSLGTVAGGRSRDGFIEDTRRSGDERGSGHDVT